MTSIDINDDRDAVPQSAIDSAFVSVTMTRIQAQHLAYLLAEIGGPIDGPRKHLSDILHRLWQSGMRSENVDLALFKSEASGHIYCATKEEMILNKALATATNVLPTPLLPLNPPPQP